jgi:Domain of unknown function (DUF1707)/Domain of unknown function (DUF4190)
VTRDPAVEPTDGDDTGRREVPRAAAGDGEDTVASAPGAGPTLPAVPGAPLPSYGPPSYAPGYPPAYGQPSYGSGYGGYGGYGEYGGYGGLGGPGPGPAYGQPGMRAAVADRERTLDVLKAAYGEGRLTREEFESRTARTMSAKYYGELAAIVADLPAGPFAPQGPGYYAPAVPVTPTNGMAVGSLVCSLIGFILPLMLVPGLVLGHIARDQIRAREQRGDGLAVAGLVFGYLGLALWVLIIALLIARPH